MLLHPTIDKMKSMKLNGMAKALEEQMQMPDLHDLAFEERLGFLIDREETERENRRLQSRLRRAKRTQSACVEAIDWKPKRGRQKTMLLNLTSCEWIASPLNLIVTGPTGVGKTYIACALAQKACQEGYSAEYHRLSRLFPALGIAKGDGSYGKLLLRLAKTDFIVLDDWGLAPFTDENRRDLLEILEDRHGKKSTMVTSQLPVSNWHKLIGDPTLADAILDRLVHDAYKIDLKGESMRKLKKKIED